MCDPVSIAALGAGAAGSIYKGQEAANTQNDMISARNAATNAELGRDKVYGDESRGVFNNSLGVFDPTAQANRLATNQTNAGNFINSNGAAPANVGTISTNTAPAAVGAGEATKLGDVFSRIGARNTAHGKLAGYDQTMFDNNVNLHANAGSIDQIGDFAKVSSGVNKTEQQNAYQNAYRNPSPIGDILQTAGQVGGYYGGKGFSPFGGAPGGTGGVGGAPDFRMGFASPGQRM